MVERRGEGAMVEGGRGAIRGVERPCHHVAAWPWRNFSAGRSVRSTRSTSGCTYSALDAADMACAAASSSCPLFARAAACATCREASSIFT